MQSKKYTYSECYSILNIQPGCSMETLRKKYKTLIQKWHPDRISKSPEKTYEATSKVIAINIAYHELEQYYKKEGRLPHIEPTKIRPQLRSSMYKEYTKTKYNVAKPHYENVPPPSSPLKQPTSSSSLGFRTKPLAFIIGSVYVGYILMNSPDHADMNLTETNIQNQSTIHETASAKISPREVSSKKPVNTSMSQTRPKIMQSPYFTYGSTISEVLSVQGPPDIVKDNIWFYGSSEVYFHDGIVTRWVRGPDRLLRVRIIHETDKKDNNTTILPGTLPK